MYIYMFVHVSLCVCVIYVPIGLCCHCHKQKCMICYIIFAFIYLVYNLCIQFKARKSCNFEK